MLFQLSLGVLRRPEVHRMKTYGKPKKSSHVAAVHGMGKAVSTSLLPMLYMVLSTYQTRMSAVSRSFCCIVSSFSVSSMQKSELFGS